MILHVACDKCENLIWLLRDLIQLDTQTEEEMKRIFYLSPPPFFGFEPDVFLRVKICIYGLPQAGLLR